jgi:hypothetical protein
MLPSFDLNTTAKARKREGRPEGFKSEIFFIDIPRFLVLLTRFSGPEQKYKVASRQMTAGVSRFSHRQQGWRETFNSPGRKAGDRPPGGAFR